MKEDTGHREDGSLARLSAAMHLYFERSAGPAEDTDDEFLSKHPDLSDILRPLLEVGECDQPPLPQVPGYQVLAELGRGGAGVVYEADHLRLGRRVAIKVLSPERRLDPRSIARFRREARIGGSLDHSAVVSVLDAGTVDGVEYLVQERIAGGRSLDDVIDEARRRPELGQAHYRRVAGMIAQAARGLEAAHAEGIIHRDVKPGNLLVTPEGDVKVADFGLAVSEDALAVSQSLAQIGTPFYMSPEQAGGAREVTAVSDVFSLGATMYEALTLHRPFDGATSREVLERVQDGDPLDPRKLREDLPAELAAVVLKCLARVPEARYASMSELADDLEGWLRGDAISVRPPGAVHRVKRWVRRHPVRATAGVATGLIVVVVTMAVASIARQSAQTLELSSQAQVRSLLELERELPPLERGYGDRATEWLVEARELLESRPHFERRYQESLETEALTQSGRWLRAELSALVDAFGTLDATVDRIAERIELARDKERESLVAPHAIAAWADAREAIAADPRYGGLSLEPQYGLLPLGADPESGLWEFAHLPSGDASVRGPDGRLVMTPNAGIVLVLLPGGTFLMGGQPHDPSAPNYDPEATSYERPVHEVTLPAFFIGKHEVTQGQWHAMTGEWPSYNRPEDSHLLPVERVSWNDFRDTLGVYGLRLPTEEEWEYGARAGTSTRFPFDEDRLSEYANLKDWANLGGDTSEKYVGVDQRGWHYDSYGWRFEEWDDSFKRTSPVGAFLPNPFGIHDTVGNVLEWCQDVYEIYDDHDYKGKDLGYNNEDMRSWRGGGYHHCRTSARPTQRNQGHPDHKAAVLGARAARSLEPGS